jgi:hypothetical protein
MAATTNVAEEPVRVVTWKLTVPPAVGVPAMAS